MDAVRWRNRLIAVVQAAQKGDPEPLEITSQRLADMEDMLDFLTAPPVVVDVPIVPQASPIKVPVLEELDQ